MTFGKVLGIRSNSTNTQKVHNRIRSELPKTPLLTLSTFRNTKIIWLTLKGENYSSDSYNHFHYSGPLVQVVEH